jgi:translation elongation factor EF-1alpha
MEKAITIYDVCEMKVIGLVIVEEIELGYIKDKIIVYGTNEIKQAIFTLLESFEQKSINTHNLNKKLAELPKGSENLYNIHFLESFEVKSKNKNKSSRYKRIIEHMNLSHLERFEYNDTRT